MTHTAKTLLKHLKVITETDIIYANMVISYADRIAFLLNAQRNNNLK